MLSKESIASENKCETSVPEGDLVSVLIPAYNHEQYVQDTIRSIIAQTYKNIELLIVDDGSSDLTWEKINELKNECEARFVRVIFQRQENQGTCVTLNRLLEQTKGKYVFLIASDDIELPNGIQTLYGFLASNPDYSCALGDAYIIDSYSNICKVDEYQEMANDISKMQFDTLMESSKFFRKDIHFNEDCFITYANLIVSKFIPNGFLVKKIIFDKIGMYTQRAPLEDYWLFLQLSKYNKIKYIDIPLQCYRRHSSNTWSKSNLSRIKKMGYMTIFHELTEWNRKYFLVGSFVFVYYLIYRYLMLAYLLFILKWKLNIKDSSQG